MSLNDFEIESDFCLTDINIDINLSQRVHCFKRGKQAAYADIISQQLGKRFGSLPHDLTTRLKRLSFVQTKQLATAADSFTDLTALEIWLMAAMLETYIANHARWSESRHISVTTHDLHWLLDLANDLKTWEVMADSA